MVHVIVTGVPAQIKMPKLVFVLKTNLKRNGLSQKFWIRGMSDIPGTNTKEMLMSFESNHDAYTAKNLLDNFVYRDGNSNYPFSAQLDEDDDRRHRSPSPVLRGRQRSRERNYGRHNRRVLSRSRSPLFNSEASKLDLEIEILRKQRLVIEEERRLLLERKKLELVREFGPNAIKEFDHRDDRPRERRRSYEREEYSRPRHRSPLPSRRNRVKKVSKGLPLFVFPCKTLINDMKQLITDSATKKESFILMKLLRSSLRKRLAVALEGKEYMSTSQIVTLYRTLYPTDTDGQLVNSLLQNIRDSSLAGLPTEKKQPNKVKSEDKEINDGDPKEPIKEDNAEAGSPKLDELKNNDDVNTEVKEETVVKIETENGSQDLVENEDTNAEPESEVMETKDEDKPMENKEIDEWVQDGVDWTEEPAENPEKSDKAEDV